MLSPLPEPAAEAAGTSAPPVRLDATEIPSTLSLNLCSTGCLFLEFGRGIDVPDVAGEYGAVYPEQSPHVSLKGRTPQYVQSGKDTEGRSTLKNMEPASRTWNAGGTSMECQSAGILPAWRLARLSTFDSIFNFFQWLEKMGRIFQ